MSRLDGSAIRAYVARDWEKVRTAKRAYWRERLARGGLREALRVTEQLHRVPSAAEREEDLQTHRRVAQALAKRPSPASARELALVAFAAVARGKRWYVFGAQAVNLYGFRA